MIEKRIRLIVISLLLVASPMSFAEHIIAFTSVGKPFTGEKELLANGHAAHVYMLNGVSALVERLNAVGKTAAGKPAAEQQALVDKIKPIISTQSFKDIAELEMKGRFFHKSLGLTQVPAVVINSGNTNYVVYGETNLVKAYNALLKQRNSASN